MRVWTSATPTRRCLRCWKACTAAAVFGPAIPSIWDRYSPCARRATCRPAICGLPAACAAGARKAAARVMTAKRRTSPDLSARARGLLLRLGGLHGAERHPVPGMPALELNRGDREARRRRRLHLHSGDQERVVCLVHVRDGRHQSLAGQVLAGLLERVDEREALGHPGDEEAVRRVPA